MENLNSHMKKIISMIFLVHSIYILILLAWYLLVVYIIQLVEDAMPAPVMKADLARDDTSTFSEESARQYLDDILGNAPRVAGTVYHLDKTRDMKDIVDGIAARANQAVHTDWQMASGIYQQSSSAPFMYVYENVSNVIAVLEGESGVFNGTIGSSVLVNCHYDSVPFSIGASDNGVFCAVMAETLSILSRRKRKLKHNIVFLFNGAEENCLQGSHGFLQHEWAWGVKTVVNLDSAGMNGKPTVFQVSDPATLRAYGRSTWFPNAQGLGEFLFYWGIIPSDTDFRIFRDFGNIHGIDIAFTKWGVVYHTRYDIKSLVRTGVIQHAGNMILALITELGESDDIEPASKSTPVTLYFDYLHIFLIRYTFVAAYVMDTFIVLLGLITVGYFVWLVGFQWSTIKELLLSVVGRLVAALTGIIVVLLFTGIMMATTVQLRYLSKPWLVVPLYWLPFFIGAIAVSQAFDAWRTKKSGLRASIRTIQAQAATRLILCMITLLILCDPLLSTVRYLFTTPLCIMSIMSLVSITCMKYFTLNAPQHLLLELFLSLPSTLFTLSLALLLDAIFLPITGRYDSGDIVVAILNVMLAINVAVTLSGIELLFSRKRLWLPLSLVGAVCVVLMFIPFVQFQSGIELLFSRKRLWLPLSLVGAVCVVLMFIPFAPYRDDGPATMRHYWFHTEIVTFDENKVPTETITGVVISKQDVNTISNAKKALESSAYLTMGYSGRCENRVYCDLPLYSTIFEHNLPTALFVRMDGPVQFSPPPDITYTRQCLEDICTYIFTVVGTSHNTVTIWPYVNVTVTSWSYSAPLTASFTLQDRPVYLIVHSVATYPVMKPWEFSLQCKVAASLQSQPSLRVSLHAHKIYHPEEFTSQYKSLMKAMPRYYNIATFLSYRHNYVF